MYIGSTDTRGLMHCLWEIIDNAVDEALGGFGAEILVTLRPDGGISVVDHGRGIPVDLEPRTGLSGVEVVFTKLHAGGKFGGTSYAATGGLHGVGASVVNALSARLDVEVDRGGKTYGMSFRRGEPGIFSDRGGKGPDGTFTAYESKSALHTWLAWQAEPGLPPGTAIKAQMLRHDSPDTIRRARASHWTTTRLNGRLEARR